MNCIICTTELTGRQKKFCSRKCTNRDTNLRNQNYEAQQARGLRRKLQAVKDRGGACTQCGYSKNLSCLSFHHRSDKSFGLDIRKFSNCSQRRLDAELEKCDLLCVRCHTEHHNPNLEMDLLL